MRAQVVSEAGVADPPTDRFDVRPASEVYLQSGKFSVEHMTTVLSDSLDEVVAEGSGLLRATGEMPWPGVLLQPHGADDFFVYEAALNDIVAQKPAVFMCMYDLQRFGLDTSVAVLRDAVESRWREAIDTWAYVSLATFCHLTGLSTGSVRGFPAVTSPKGG